MIMDIDIKSTAKRLNSILFRYVELKKARKYRIEIIEEINAKNGNNREIKRRNIWDFTK